MQPASPRERLALFGVAGGVALLAMAAIGLSLRVEDRAHDRSRPVTVARDRPRDLAPLPRPLLAILLDGRTVAPEFDLPRHARARGLRAVIEVFPDDFYVRQVYPGLLAPGAAGHDARGLIEQALKDGTGSRFTPRETTAPLALAR